MNAVVRLFKSDGIKKNGYPVKVILSGNNKISRRTISYSEEIDWNPSNETPKNTHDDFEDLYGRILDIRKKASKMAFRELDDFDQAYGYLLENAGRTTKTTDFFEWGERCVKLLQDQKRNGTAKSYTNSLTALKRFRPRLKFSELNAHLLNDFKIFCKGRGNENKTIRHYGGALKAIYNRAVDAGVIEDKKPFSGYSKGVPVRDRRKKQRYLDIADIRKLENVDLPPAQQRSVDFLLLQFYLGGVDFVDLYHLKKKQLVNNRIIFERQKASDMSFEFDVLVPPKAEKIMEKYWNHNGVHVFPWAEENINYDTFIGNTRRYLATVQEKLNIKLKPKDQKLTTKVARHTFATLGKFAQFHEDILREIQGHERNDIDTAYKAKFLEAERDAAQLKIIGENAFFGKTKTLRKAKGVSKKVKRK